MTGRPYMFLALTQNPCLNGAEFDEVMALMGIAQAQFPPPSAGLLRAIRVQVF
jgi:hypothetical protein